jgi:hypothetical protein
MSKNTTRKGLALGAASALILAGFSTAPAYAAGVDGTAQLVPTTGYSAGWAVPATTTATFSSTFTTTDSSGGTIKFLVEDPTGRVEPTGASEGRNLITLAGASDSAEVLHATNTVILTDGAAITGLEVGDVISFTVAVATGGGILADADTAYAVTAVSGNTFSFVSTTAYVVGLSANIAAATALTSQSTGIVEVVREKRATDNSYVIDTGVLTSSAQAATVILSNVDGAANTRSATIKGWVDRAALLNDRIDTIESTSTAETVTFVKISEITASTALRAPTQGDTTLSAVVTTTPVLNGAQSPTGFVKVLFTRQDSSLNGVSGDITQSTVNGGWTGSVLVESDLSNIPSWTASDAALSTGTWGFTRPEVAMAEDSTAEVIRVSVTAGKVVTVTTTNAHNLRTGDKVTVTSADLASIAETAARVTVTSATTFTYSLTTTAAVTAASDDSLTDTTVTVVTYTESAGSAGDVALVDRVFAGTHSAVALIETNIASSHYTKTGAVSSLGTLSVASADVVLTTAASATVQGSRTTADDAARDAFVKAGTTAVAVVATIVDEDGDALGAGRSVAFTVTRSSSTTRVNGQTASGTAVTDANGQVQLAVTDTLGLAGTTLTIDVTAENVASSDITLEWAAQSFGLYDLNVSDSAQLSTSTRVVGVGASYTLNLLVADQFAQAPVAGDYRLAVSGAGVTNGFVEFANGLATVTVTDSKVATSFESRLTLQKKGTTGVFANTTTVVVLTTNTTDKARITLGADGTALYDNPVATVDLSDAVAKVALVERDTRRAFSAQPVYANDVVLAGKVTNTTTGANIGNAVVTISGPASILFSDGAVDKRGSINVVSDTNGEFSVKLFSTTAQTDTVITVNAAGATAATTKVTFTGIGVGEGTSLVVTAPAAVKPASTFQVKAKLSDAFGNGVAAAAGRVKVTYTGPGIIFGTLPTSTDANGELMFSVLLGANDTGSVSVTVSYDQNGDGDYVDAKDLNTSATIAINATGTVAAAGKVNVGSFNGKLVVYALGLDGAKISWKVAGRWGTAVADGDALNRFDRPVGASGVNVIVEIYVNGVKQLTKTVLTK